MLNCILILCLTIGAHADLEISKHAKNSGVIVNPFYDPKDDINGIKKSHLDHNIVLPPTHQQLAETYNIRNTINNAVRRGTYAVGGDGSAMTKPKIPFLSWLRNLSALKLSSANSDQEEDEEVGTGEAINQATLGDNEPIQPLTKNDTREIKTNVIDSAVVSRLDNRPFIIPQKKVQREQLELISIEEDLTFPHGHNIRSWITIEGKTSETNGLVGISNSSLVLIVDKNGIYEIVEEMDLKTTILCFTNYLQWNHTSKSVHGVVIVEIPNQLLFISTRDDLSGLEIIWQWTIHTRLDYLTYFTHETSDMMLMINTPSSIEGSEISADIYRFDLHSRQTWLIQKISLNNPCKSVAVINTYRELVLCFAQNKTVELYKSHRGTSFQIFNFFTTIEANNVQTVSGFQMGGYSYLAIAGFEPKIFRYHRGSFIAQTILSRNWGLVEIIFPVPARTYRDDLILLVQHRIMMGTHTVSVVEPLIWDGESFDVTLSIPCKIGDTIMDFGMTCMLDYDRDAGIEGLSIIQKGSSISLIVPRMEAPSSMFRLMFELKSLDSPDSADLKNFEMMSKSIEATTSHQNDILSKGNDALVRGLKRNSRNDIAALWHLIDVSSDNLNILNDGVECKFDEIFFGTEKWTEENLHHNFEDLMNALQNFKNMINELEKESTENNAVEPTPELPVQNRVPSPVNGKFDMKNARVLKKGSRTKRTGEPERQMKYSTLKVKQINVDYINNVPIDDIIFIKDGVLNSVNSLVIENNLKVLNEATLTSEYKETVGESIEDRKLKDAADNIHVTSDLVIDSINGIPWNQFALNVVLRNIPNFLQELKVKGTIVANADIKLDYLNLISFPKGYLWMHNSDISTISGQKVFKGTLTTNSLDTSGPVDGISTQDTISLMEQQHIRGLTTFEQLEVTESLDVNGTINGEHLSDFKENPSLLESNIIPSDCLFQNLRVEGPIFISNNLNGFPLDGILGDVVYKSSPKTIISSFKTFESVESVVELTSNLINDIPVWDYMTTDTTQNINFDRFVGNVLINNLHTDGLFNFINVTELDRNSIKLMGEQFIEAEIIFESDAGIDIEANTIEIQRSFNGLSLEDLIRIDEPLEINGNVVINSALVNDLSISGQVNGNGVVDGINLSEFDLIRFSRTRPQDITSMYYIEKASIYNNIDANYVNGIIIDDLRKHISHVTNLPEFMSSTDVKVNNLVIDGSLLVQKINGHDFNSIKDNAVWLNQPNIVDGEFEFLDKFEIAQGVIVHNVNNVEFDSFIRGLVLKTDENVVFTGRKNFQNEFHVEQDILVNIINGIAPTNIWTKSSSPQIAGPVNIIGNLFVENLKLQGYINSISWREIEDKYNFNFERSAHVLTNNVQFIGPTIIKDLHIQYGLNSVENVTEFLSNIIRKNHVGTISGKKTFESNVIFMNNLQAAVLDNVDVPSLLNNIVINDVNEKIIVFGDIAFDDEVAASLIHVSGDILASNVMGCSLSEWKDNSLTTNSRVKIFESVVFPIGTFQTQNFELQFLNGNSLATIITLDTDQFIRGHLLLSDITCLSNINGNGLVNSLNIKELIDNSVLVTGDNYISAPTTLQDARVLYYLQTVDTVNGKNLNNIATLHEDLHLYGPLSFQSIKARNLNTKDTISGIDFDYWYLNSLWKNQRENQIISGTWTVSEGIFHSAIKGSAILNGIPIENLAGQISAHQSNVVNNLNIFNQGYIETCHKLENLIQRTQTLPFFLTHFEESFSLRVQSVLNSVHFFEAAGQSYLVMNLGCTTVIYFWNRQLETYEKVCESETGNVDSWLDMMDETKLIHLISNTEGERSNCPTSGLNIWKFDGSSLVHVSKITDSNKFALLHHSKLHPQRFLALSKDDGVVNEFDLQNNLVEQWHLPGSDQQFRFVPESANLGMALSNGKQLSSLSSTKSLRSNIRKERSIGALTEAMGNFSDIKRFIRCPFLDDALQNATVNCELWKQTKLKAMSNVGTFKTLDTATRSRLLSDAEKNNIQVGSSPLKVKIRGPNKSFSSMHIYTGKVQEPITTLVNDDQRSFAKGVFGNAENITSFKAANVDSLLSSERGPDESFNFTPTATLQEQKLDTTLLNETQASNSSARDMFGDIEKATIKVVDNVVDSLIELETNNNDIDFDDSLIGSSENQIKIESGEIKNSSNTNETVNNQPTSSRDMFGNIESKTIKFADKVMDVFKNIKDIRKESKANIQNMFNVKPVGDGYRKKEDNSDEEKIDKKNLPKIPEVTYATNDTMEVTQSPPTSVTEATTTSSVTEETATTNFPQENLGEEEPQISKEITSEGIATAENQNFPNHPAEEIVAITVGKNQKHLIAVSSLKEHTIQGKHDLIRIYEDIIEGNLFQTLVCHRPRSLSVLNIRDETILTFIENDAEVQIFIYRGIQGFVKFTSFELPSFISKLTPIHLPIGNSFACTKSYLAAIMKKEIRFIEAKSCGYCGINAQLKCD